MQMEFNHLHNVFSGKGGGVMCLEQRAQDEVLRGVCAQGDDIQGILSNTHWL